MEAVSILGHTGIELLLFFRSNIFRGKSFKIKLYGREGGFQFMGYVSNEVIVQACKFPLNGKVSEYNENGGSNTGDHYDANDKDANFRVIEHNSGRDFIPFPDLFISNII
jgi:hypothetical protein